MTNIVTAWISPFVPAARVARSWDTQAACAVVLTTAILILDVSTPKGWAVWALYLLPLLLLAPRLHQGRWFLAPTLYSLLIVLPIDQSPLLAPPMLLLNRCMGMFVIWISAVGILRRNQQQELLGFKADLLANIHDAVLSVNADDVLTSWNRAAEELYQRPASDVLGRPIDEVLPGFGRRGQAPVLRDALAAGGQWQGLLTQKRADGKPIRVDAHAISLRRRRRRDAGYVSVNRDVTARENAERALHRSEARSRSLVELSSDFVWVTDHKGAVFEPIPSWNAFTGQTHEQANGWGWLDAIHPDDKAATRGAWLVALAQRAPCEMVFRIRRHDGEYRLCFGRATPMIEPNGDLHEWVGCCTDITERKRAERELAFSNSLLRTQQETALDGILVVDDRGQVISFNQRFVEMWEVPAEILATRSDERTLRTAIEKVADPERFLKRISELYEHRQEKSHDEVALRDGRTFERYSAPMFNEAGDNYYGRVWYFRDITQRKSAEEQTRALLGIAQAISGTLDQRELLERVQRETAGVLGCDAVFTLRRDPETGTQQVDADYGLSPELQGLLRTLEWRPGDDWGQRVVSGEACVLNGMEDASPAGGKLFARFGLGSLLAAPLRVRGRRYGTLIAARSAARKPFQANELALCVGIAHQLSVAMETVELHQAQQEEAEVSTALARIGQQLISSLGGGPMLDRLCAITAEVFLSDTTFTILWQPEEHAYVVAAMHGWSAEDCESLRTMRLPSESFAGLIPTLASAGFVQVNTEAAPTRWAALPAQYGLSSCLYVPLRRGEEIIGILGIGFRARREGCTGRDERVLRGVAHVASLALENARLFADLARANRLKSDFVATMSHELRTPMNIIMGYNELLLDQAFGPLTGEQEETLQCMGRSEQQLLELINGTLDLSRLEAGRLPVVISEVHLAELIHAVRVDTQPLRAQKPDLKCEWKVAPGLPALATDAVKVKIIVKKLIDNAIKFTDEGAIGVTVAAHADGVEIRVWDTGIGIAREQWPIIFEPFRQLESSLTRRHGGVGLGLYLVRRMVDLLNGTITLDSEVGRGSEFRVWLPVVEGTAPAIGDPVAGFQNIVEAQPWVQGN